jgi:23S rRNA (adenine2503-C2)-methyltransferase
MTDRPLIFDLSQAEIKAVLNEWGEPAYRAAQIWHGLYQSLWAAPDEFTTLSKSLREKLGAHFSFSHLEKRIELDSTDQHTTKILFDLPDGQAIETVLMRYDDRNTLCISSQAGCAMGCVFCATGQMGFKRNLTSGEIIEQVLFFARRLDEEEKPVTNVVMMGMGEPFHNYEATLGAIDRLNDADGLNLGARRFTISTVGLIPAIQRFTQENHQYNLAISLHSAFNARRSEMLPINDRFPIEDLIRACRDYVGVTHRRVTFEWALIDGVNDTPEEAHQLGKLLKGLLCHVNVIPLNPTDGFAGQRSTEDSIAAFRSVLAEYGVSCTVRVRRGIDIAAGCGQLANKQASR